MLNFPTKDCRRRDFVPGILNSFADLKLVQEVLVQKDYTSFAKQIENIPSFDAPNIHGSGHFGVGGVLGTIGNSANSPGGRLLVYYYGEKFLTHDRSVVLSASRQSRLYLMEVATEGPCHSSQPGGRAYRAI